MSQTPTLGRIVLVRVRPSQNNGSTTAPAMVTRVWNEHPDGGWIINVRVMVDTDVSPLSLTSIRLSDEEPADDVQHVAWWPPRA